MSAVQEKGKTPLLASIRPAPHHHYFHSEYSLFLLSLEALFSFAANPLTAEIVLSYAKVLTRPFPPRSHSWWWWVEGEHCGDCLKQRCDSNLVFRSGPGRREMF